MSRKTPNAKIAGPASSGDTMELRGLSAKKKVEGGMSTPAQCVSGEPRTVNKGCENNDSTTPTLPQGAAAERQHHLQKKDVRRRLDMELASPTDSDLCFKTPPVKRSRTKISNGSAVSTVPLNSPSPRRSSSAAMEKSRFDSSLGLLTKRFLGLLQSAENGILDLNQASVTLAVQKRRIYDITNVLEGIGLLKKISKNNIQWKGSNSSPSDSSEYQTELGQDLANLESKENQLDELISSAEDHLRRLSEDKRYAYVTYNDLKNVSEYREDTVMAVRAPPETKLQVPHPSEGYQIYMKSTQGEIQVFLCPEDEMMPSSSFSSPSSPRTLGCWPFSPSSSSSSSMRSRSSHRIKNSPRLGSHFIDEDDKDGLLLETLDHNQQQPLNGEAGLDISSMASATEPFLCLEPPLDESDYSFTMDDNEGISNLFDFSF